MNTAHSLLKRYNELNKNVPNPNKRKPSDVREWWNKSEQLDKEIEEFFKIKNPHANKY